MHNSYRLFDLETGATPAEIVNGRYEMLGYYQAQVMLEYRHPEDRYRRDKHFLATLNLDYVIHEHDENFYILQMDIRKTFQRKLDDVMFRFSEMHIFSGESFYRDYDITDFLLRGYDGGKLFTRHAWMLSSEYRMAVYRDIIKFIFLWILPSISRCSMIMVCTISNPESVPGRPGVSSTSMSGHSSSITGCRPTRKSLKKAPSLDPESLLRRLSAHQWGGRSVRLRACGFSKLAQD